MNTGSDIVVIGGVRYRRADAERRGLLPPASAPRAAGPLTTSAATGAKGRSPKNKAARPEDK